MVSLEKFLTMYGPARDSEIEDLEKIYNNAIDSGVKLNEEVAKTYYSAYQLGQINQRNSIYERKAKRNSLCDDLYSNDCETFTGN